MNNHIIPYLPIKNVKDNGYVKFHKFYLTLLVDTGSSNSLKKPNNFNEKAFFSQFKIKYSLQGISNEYLDYLTENKENIIKLINEDNIHDLFFNYFAKAQIKHKETFKSKELSSFFAKLLHTFKPNEYCALDNPIKDYFDLKRESFLIAFFCINAAYEKWNSNANNINNLREKIKDIDTKNDLQVDLLSNKKILDMVYWHKANVKKDKNTEG